MGTGKSPGPDGYILEFYKHNWGMVAGSLVEAYREFQATALFPTSWGDTKLVFIPKKPNACKVEDLRLIALCNMIYKVLAKCLANRIRGYLGGLISQE